MLNATPGDHQISIGKCGLENKGGIKNGCHLIIRMGGGLGATPMPWKPGQEHLSANRIRFAEKSRWPQVLMNRMRTKEYRERRFGTKLTGLSGMSIRTAR